MAKLDISAAGPVLFAPVVFRLPMRLEQVSFGEFVSDPTEAVYVLRAAQRLFRSDVVTNWFDTWLEAEAAGAIVERDPLGVPRGVPQPPASRQRVADVLTAPPIVQAVEIVRRLTVEIGSDVVPAAMLTGPVTLLARFADDLEYAADLSVGLARAYCEAGAGALLLVEEEASPDLAALDAFAPLFNLARYYDRPVVLVSWHPLSPTGEAVAARLTGGLYVTPTQAGTAVRPLPDGAATPGSSPRALLAMSRWEVDAATPPETVASWRHALAPV